MHISHVLGGLENFFLLLQLTACSSNNRGTKKAAASTAFYSPQWHLSWATISNLTVRLTWAEFH